MKHILFLSIGFLYSIQVITAQFPEFKYHEIGTVDEMMLGQSSLHDIDQDGDMDWIVGSSGSTIWWFEYVEADNWKRHTLGDNSLTDRGGVIVDVDGDGLPDQVSGGTWYKNPGTKGEAFTRYENGGIIAYDNAAADINGDGISEIFATSEQDGTFIYFIGNKPTKKWKSIKIGEGVPGGIWPQPFGDIDGDGDLDIIRSNLWYDNLDGSGTKWTEHKTLRFLESQGKFAYSSRVFVVDMDSDGDMDVVQSQANIDNGSVAWHENKDGRGINWYTHPIGTETEQDLHSLCVADFDNDGDLDIFSGGGPMGKDLYKRCFIWENMHGEGEKWEKHEVLFKRECIDAVAADIDADGDVDICSKEYKGEKNYYLENLLITK